MKKIVNYTALVLIISTVFYACDDFIEEDIENESVSLLAPRNNLTTIQLTHTFWWDWLEDAEIYNMQIVEGSFSSAINFVLDTTVSKNKFDVTLYPGTFQWRVRGENNGSVTDYTTFNLVIDSTLDISSLQVVLNSPVVDEITNNDSVFFSWTGLSNVDEYYIEIHENDLLGASVLSPTLVNETAFSKVLNEGTYLWGVLGRNLITGSSTNLETRTLIIDTTSPNIASLILPEHDSILLDTFNTYTWTQAANTGQGTPTELTDKIYFYSDSGSTIIAGFPKLISVGTTQYIDSIGIDHYWKVETEDAAGNVAEMTTLSKVRIQ